MVKSILKRNARRTLNFCSAFYHLVLFYFFESSKIKKSNVVFFLPVYHTGGAERVHLNILKSLENSKIVVIFTENSTTKNFFYEFKKYAEVIEINSILTKNNYWLNRLLTYILIKKINKSHSLKTVFGCNTQYYYCIISKIRESVKKIDLFHAFEYQDHREFDVIKTVSYIDHRILINNKALEDLKSIYLKHKIDELFYNRLTIIGNGINFGSDEFFIRDHKIIKVGFVGRWSEEKRPFIFLEIAKKVIPLFENVEFVMAGTGMKPNLKIINEAGITFLGELTSEKQMIKLYEDLTILLVPSDREGFPMIIMESMSSGVIPIATNVGGISEHLISNKNGILINENDDKMVSEAFFSVLYNLLNDSERMQELSQNAYNYAHANFRIENFQKSYRKIFNSNKQ